MKLNVEREQVGNALAASAASWQSTTYKLFAAGLILAGIGIWFLAHGFEPKLPQFLQPGRSPVSSLGPGIAFAVLLGTALSLTSRRLLERQIVLVDNNLKQAGLAQRLLEASMDNWLYLDGDRLRMRMYKIWYAKREEQLCLPREYIRLALATGQLPFICADGLRIAMKVLLAPLVVSALYVLLTPSTAEYMRQASQVLEFGVMALAMLSIAAILLLDFLARSETLALHYALITILSIDTASRDAS